MAPWGHHSGLPELLLQHIDMAQPRQVAAVKELLGETLLYHGVLHIFLLLFRNKFFSSTLLVPGRCCFRQWLAPGAQADAVLDNGLLRVRKPMLLPAGAELWSYFR